VFNDLHWKDYFDLSEETYGLSGPVSVTPISSLAVDSENDDNPSIFKATVRFRIFHREKDKYTIYHVKPNIINGQTISVKQVLHSSAYSLASSEDLVPLDCHRQQSELFRICHRLPPSAAERLTFNPLTKCAAALLDKIYNVDHLACPSTKPSIDPVIYRADCDQDGHSSVVISSSKPLELAFICDKDLDSSKNFTTFPVRVKTDCEVRQLAMGLDGVIVPQSNPDFEQDPILGPEIPFNHPTPAEPFDYIFKIVIPVSAGSGILTVLSISIYCCWKCCPCCRNRHSVELGVSVPSNTFVRAAPRSQSHSIQMQEYPLL